MGDFYTGLVVRLFLIILTQCFKPEILRLILLNLQRNNIPELGSRGPFTVFAPNADAYNKPEVRLKCDQIKQNCDPKNKKT